MFRALALRRGAGIEEMWVASGLYPERWNDATGWCMAALKTTEYFS